MQYKKCCKKNCCTHQDVIEFLGEYLYDLLKTAQLPIGHPSVCESICALINGQSLPPGHPTLEEILCKILDCDDDHDCYCCCNCKCNKHC